jgi:hypothetical protein
LAPEHGGNPASLIGQLRTEASETGCAFVGFDFPIGVPAFYAKRAGISSFRALLPKLGRGKWKHFYAVCDMPGQISVRRPFYPNAATSNGSDNVPTFPLIHPRIHKRLTIT